MPIQPSGNPLVFTGTLTSPAGISTVASTGTITTQLYLVRIRLYIDGTVAAATDDDNFALTINTAGVSNKRLICPSNGSVVEYELFAVANNVSVSSAGAGTAGSVLHATVMCIPYGSG